MVRAVLDTNVLVSALTHEGKPRKLLLELLKKHTVILSSQMIAEFEEVMDRDKFNVTSSQVNRFLSSIISMSKIVPDNALFKGLSQDPDDDVVLNAAHTGKAEFVVTGDCHLLELGQFKKTKIVTVNQMQDILVEKQVSKR